MKKVLQDSRNLGGNCLWNQPVYIIPMYVISLLLHGLLILHIVIVVNKYTITNYNLVLLQPQKPDLGMMLGTLSTTLN